jgi:hypothetical protein
MIISRVLQKRSVCPIVKSCDYRRLYRPRTLPTMMTIMKKMKRVTMRKTRSQQSSENRTNVDAKNSGLRLLEITNYR